MTGTEKTRTVSGKPKRSETVSIRLDPRLNYLCELAARSQRRTKSSFIEAAIDEKIQSMHINNWRDMDDNLTIGDRSDYLWHVREPERIVSLGLAAPHLMTFEEQQIWAVICETGFFWRGHYGSGELQHWEWDCVEKSINRSRVREYWDDILKVAQGDLDRSCLPQIGPREKPKATSKASPPPFSSEEDIPF